MTAVIALAIATPAFADIVSYDTTGQFSGGSNVYTGADGLTITYGDTVGNTVSAPWPTNASFGTFTVVDPTAGFSDIVNTAFSMTVTQTNPTAGTETLVDAFAGTISATLTGGNSNVVLTFTGASGDGGAPTLTTDPIDGAPAYTFALDNVTYYVDRITPIEPQSTNGGVSTINGAISVADVPEPGYFGLIALGIAGLVVLRIRRVPARR